MGENLPPLTALRAFEAAARHMSFSRAADELNVTPAALSFQIKSLEDHLGTPVFRRLNRAVELTEERMVVLGQLADGVDPDSIEVGQEMQLVLGMLYENDENEYVVWKWKPVAA